MTANCTWHVLYHTNFLHRWAGCLYAKNIVSKLHFIQGRIQSLERGVHFVEKVEDQKKKKEREAE